jgi:tellurite methyltransferase
LTEADRAKWDSRYGGDDHWHGEFHTSAWLTAHTPKLEGGVALDIACGVGQNAVWLAQQGLQVMGIDGSWIGLRRAQQTTKKLGIDERVLFAQADLDQFRPAPHSVDFIVVMRFLSRDLYPSVEAALKPGGWLIMETFNLDFRKVRPDIDPAFLLNHGEWHDVFGKLRVVAEEEREGVSYFVGQKA